MAPKYLKYFPKPLLEDLIAGRWLPIIGAGFSKNAVLPHGKKMPLWADLGIGLGAELGDYAPTSALDAISAFEHEFGRPKLIERLWEALLISESQPGHAHQAFCSVPFDLVCTTNFDFLLEREYENIPRNCTPLVDEEQLSINFRDPCVSLLKLHGDLRHPARLIATETDYDQFLNKYPLLATYLANLLITRTAVLVGYSFDDPDFRQVWQIIGERLGKSRRTAYAIAVGAKPTDISRFDRRGIKIINLPLGKSNYGDVLADAFGELRAHWQTAIIPSGKVKEEESLRELSLPADAKTRLCFVAVPLSLQSFYRERVFPLVRQHGFVPVTADDVVTPGDTILSKVDALIGRALLMIIDASSEFTLSEFRFGTGRLPPGRILLIGQQGARPPSDLARHRYIQRPDVNLEDADSFLATVDEWLGAAATELRPTLLAEPSRLLEAGENRAAVISAISLLESLLRRCVTMSAASSPKAVTWRDLLHNAQNQGLLGQTPMKVVQEWLRTRNEIVHGPKNVTKSEAKQIVNGVQTIAEISVHR
jgi:hypothetical protein